MASKKKEYSFHMRENVTKHYLNDDSELQIATKMLISCSPINSIITKYKKNKMYRKYPWSRSKTQDFSKCESTYTTQNQG